jgi:hypothetical protein
MNDDVRTVIYGTIIGFFVVVLSWLSIIYISACGFTLSCYKASPLVIRTPIPTLSPAHAANPNPVSQPGAMDFNQCQVAATDLIGAWVNASSPETEAFPFTDVNGNPCEGTFAADVQHLFVDNSVWYKGAIGCVSCHNAEQTDRNGGLDLTSYAGIVAGAQNKDILGNGNWESSVLHDVLLVHGLVPAGHSPDAPPVNPPVLYAGLHVAQAGPTATPTP